MALRNKVNDAVQRTIDQMVADGREIGVQIAAWVGEEQVVDCWAGVANSETGQLVDGDTLFNVYSVSKIGRAHV